MTTLEPINITEKTERKSPVVKCDVCPNTGQAHDMIDFVANVLSPGHPKLTGIACPTQHWACSLECWIKVAHACIDEHLLEVLKFQRKNVGMIDNLAETLTYREPE